MLACWWSAASLSHAQLFDGKLNPFKNREPSGPSSSRELPPGAADITFVRDYGVPKPQPLFGPINTIKGHEVKFTIGAQTNVQGMAVEFLVRTRPTAGKILILHNRERRDTATVIYSADPNSAATMDSFTFAARYPGGKYSNPMRVDIKIADASALLMVSPQKVDFGELMVGQKVEKKITLSNRGNAPSTHRLDLFAPWKLISPKNGMISLNPGQSIELKIAYEPIIEGEASYFLQFGSGCQLSGKAIKPFSLVKEDWELKYNPKTGRREVDVLVMNHSKRPYEALLRTSSRLNTAANLYTILIPGKENPVKVYLEPEDVAAFDGALEVKIKEGFSVMASVFANIQESELEVEIPGQVSQEFLNFGPVTAGRSVEKGIVLRNRGGELLALEGEVNPPFRILSDLSRQMIPMEKLPLTIGFFPDKADRGAADQILTLRTKNQSKQIRLVGNALRPANAPRDLINMSTFSSRGSNTTSAVASGQQQPVVTVAPTAPVATPPGSGASFPAPAFDATSAPVAPTPAIDRPPVSREPVPSPDRIRPGQTTVEKIASLSREEYWKKVSPFGVFTEDLIERDLAPGLKPATDFELLKATASSLEFSWTAPKGSELDSYEVEVRGQRLDAETGALDSVWAPYPSVSYEKVGRLVKAKITDLAPFRTYEFRVFTIDLNGRSSPPSLSFGTMTTRTMDWTYIYLSIGLLALGLMVWAIIKIIRDRRGEVYRSEFVDG